MKSSPLTRRDLARLTAAGIAAQAVPFAVAQSDAKKETPPPAATAYVTDFILNTKYEDLPPQVLELSKKSILDGLGLALCGSVAKSGGIVRQYLKATGIASGPATVIGSNIKAPVRFAAFANGIGIHADDYDDTQLAVAPDRVYGLLTHPSAPALPAVAPWFLQTATGE